MCASSPSRRAVRARRAARVATSVAEGATPYELFSVVAEEVVGLLDVSSAAVVRFDSDESVVVPTGWSPQGNFTAVRYGASGGFPTADVANAIGLSEPASRVRSTTFRPAKASKTSA